MDRRLRTTSALAVVVMILVGACSSAASPTPGASAPAASAPAASAPAASAPAGSPAASPAAALPAVPTGYAELDKALTKGADGKMPFAGKRVTIQTQWIGGEGADFDAAVADFEAATGIDVVQESIASQHEVVLRSRIEGKTPPDLAMLAQPAAIVEYGKRGLTADVSKIMDPAKLNAEFPSSFGTKLFSGANGEIYAVPFKVDVKSTIWYPIKAFKAAGYEVPKTWDEMKALEAKIVADGNGSPWCVNIKDGAEAVYHLTYEIENEPKPCCVADLVFRYYN